MMLATHADPSARSRAERILAAAAALARGCALLILLGTLSATGAIWAGSALLVVTGLVVAETAAYVAVTLRRGVVTPRWAIVDTLALAATVWPGGVLMRIADPGAAEAGYRYLMVGVVAVGLARWSFPSALAAATLIGAAAAANALVSPEPGYPTWNAIPDTVAPMGAVVVVTVIATLLRGAAGELDRHREASVERAATLAEERERVRQTEALRGELLASLAAAAEGETVVDPWLRDQLRAEVAWLREVVASGLVSAPTALLPGLRQLVADKSQRMTLELHLPADEPQLSQPVVEALVEAVREALTNVEKHAGSTVASIRVWREAGGVVVAVNDAGRGFDPAQLAAGHGLASSIHGRLAEVGGRADIAAHPGQGTEVRLWAPADQPALIGQLS